MKQIIIIFTTIILGIALAFFLMGLKPKGEAMTQMTNSRLDQFTEVIQNSGN